MSRSICIAHGGDISEPSGGTNRVIAFARALCNNGFNVHLVVPCPKKGFPKDLNDINIHTVPIKARSISDQIFRALLVSLKAKRIAKNNNAILQIEHAVLAGFATLVGCSNFVLDMHDLSSYSPAYLSLPFSKLVQNFVYNMEKRAVNRASKIIVVSNPMKDFIVKEWNVPEEKIEVIPNGYFEDKFKDLNLENIEEAKGMIAFLGTLHQKIDLDKIINLAKSIENSKIYIIGDGPMRRKLQRMIKENKLENIILTGRLPLEEALKLTAKAQVVIHPIVKSLSSIVACPTKPYEYGILGKAIVADEVGEIYTILKEKNAALVSDPSDRDKFIKNVRILLEDEKLRKKISSNAKETVKIFSWKNQAKKLVGLYK